MIISFDYNNLECYVDNNLDYDTTFNLSLHLAIKSSSDFIEFRCDNNDSLIICVESSFRTMLSYKDGEVEKIMFQDEDSLDEFVVLLKTILFKINENNCLD